MYIATNRPTEMTQYEELEKYMRQDEPDKLSRGVAWATAIGLQEVDRLYTSDYLRETALRNIDGEISIDEALKLIDAYYSKKDIRGHSNDVTEEADKVSANIAKLLGEEAFVFSPAGLISTHRRIFQDVFDHAGKIRDYNITKKEWVLNGDSVLYAPASEIMSTLEYDFAEEKKFSYQNLALNAIIDHITGFVSGIWQIHPFYEGNTRTTAVFLIKYLRSLGFNIDNKPFVEYSWYFRNALVRANVKIPAKGIEQSSIFLRKFFENLLDGKNHQLKNRYMHIHYHSDEEANQENRQVNDPENCYICENIATNRLSDQATDQANHIATKQPNTRDYQSKSETSRIFALIKVLIGGPKSRNELMKSLGLRHIPSFRKNYLQPAINAGYIERSNPAKPTDSNQRYLLTDKGRKSLEEF